jgi:hypothetical protein
LLTEEEENVIASVLEVFKKHNPRWEGVNVIITDKDMTERNAIVKCTQNLLFAKCVKPKLRFWRIFQTGTCYMIPLQTRVAQ